MAGLPWLPHASTGDPLVRFPPVCKPPVTPRIATGSGPRTFVSRRAVDGVVAKVARKPAKAKAVVKAKAAGKSVKRSPAAAKPAKAIRKAASPAKSKPSRAKPSKAPPVKRAKKLAHPKRKAVGKAARRVVVKKPRTHAPGELAVAQPAFTVKINPKPGKAGASALDAELDGLASGLDGVVVKAPGSRSAQPLASAGKAAPPVAAAAPAPAVAGRLAAAAAKLNAEPIPEPVSGKGSGKAAVAVGKSAAPAGRAGATTANKNGMTYAASGVDIHREDKAIDALAGMVNFARQGFGAPMGRIGHFAGLVDFGPELALVLCTDGVGSKLEIANHLRKWDSVGIDCMAMNVNDCICVGAEPLAFVDYLAVEDPDPDLTRQIGIGLNEGARQANCSLVGGETASLPGIVKGFDLAGTCMGFVRKAGIVDGTSIKPGDVLIGLASTGIHSNGYSLVRRAFEAAGHQYTDPWPWKEDKAYAGQRIGDVLLEPTRIYVREVMALVQSGIPVHGLSHITGSGLRKLRRINQGVRYDITDPLQVHPVFKRVQKLGNIADAEMYKTFNMGMGFVVVVPAAHAKAAVAFLKDRVEYDVKVVGTVSAGTGVHHPVGGVH